MISVSGKHWEEVKIPKRLIDKVKNDFDLNDCQAKIALSRSYTDHDLFLINNEIKLYNPFLKTKDFLSGCELLKNNFENHRNILIIGDYDVDGCISTSIFFNFLKKNNQKVNYYIPDRFKDGYGASKNLIINLTKKFKPNLIIFLDCGSNSYDTLKYLKSKRISTLIIDHHNTTLPFPISNVFINPKKYSDYGQYSYLCTSFLTYLFLDIFIKKYKLSEFIESDLVFVLLATVADVMPMKGINKVLAKHILRNFHKNENFIFKIFFEILEIKNKLTLYDLGFKIAPLVNAAGRLENANQIVELFTSKNENIIKSIIQNIINLNNKRISIERKILDELDYAKFYNEKNILIIYKPNLHEGVIGIVASRIKDYFNKPCIVLTSNNNLIKGSARSTSDFNIGEYIQKAVNLNIILSGGGHNLAAGIVLEKSKLASFKLYINNEFKKKKKYSKTFIIQNYLIVELILNL
jgi:single-stranded-DNA-specific exonuclease